MSLSLKVDRTHFSPHFQPCEIVCLEHATRFLYAEVVQTVDERQVCWVHPLALTVSSLNLGDAEDENPVCYDLRAGADLLLPAVLFRPAFDVEVIPLIAHLYNTEVQIGADSSSGSAQSEVTHLIKQLCQMHPEAF